MHGEKCIRPVWKKQRGDADGRLQHGRLPEIGSGSSGDGCHRLHKSVETAPQDPHDGDALHGKRECERFFRYDMDLYSDLDGETIIRAIQEKVDRETRH